MVLGPIQSLDSFPKSLIVSQQSPPVKAVLNQVNALLLEGIEFSVNGYDPLRNGVGNFNEAVGDLLAAPPQA